MSTPEAVFSVRRVIGIDPGNVRSAAVILQDGEIVGHLLQENEAVLEWLRDCDREQTILVLETPRAQGMPASNELFLTCIWIGRFLQVWVDGHIPAPLWSLAYRPDIKLHLCGRSYAKDANVRQALIDRYGPPGTKKKPGKTYGIKADEWAALAVATTWWDYRPSGDSGNHRFLAMEVCGGV
jgi:hypothetical protein